VLELPLQFRDGFGQTGDKLSGRENSVFMYFATHHEKPIVGGMVARYPDKKERQLLSIPTYRQIIDLEDNAQAPPATFTATDLQTLDIGYVVAHRDRPVPTVTSHIEDLGLPVLADDGNTIVWKVPQP
jgi:hypothetical protein